MSSTVSLWRMREKQFEKFRANSIVLPVPPTVVRVDKTKAYSLHIMSVLNWVLPDSILCAWSLPASRSDDDDDDDGELLVTVGVHVSLFHSTSKRFFGNTWVSPEIAVDAFQIKQDRHTKDNTICYIVENVVLNFRAYFLSGVVDPNCVGICELVAYEKDPDSKATISVVGCGWTILPLLTSSQSLAGDKAKSKTPSSAFAIGSSGEAVNVFVGSPRILWELSATQWQAQEKQDRCKFYYQLVLTEEWQFGEYQHGKNPKLLLREGEDTSFEDALATFVKLVSLVPKSILLEEDFTLHVIATRVTIHLREEIEANLVARLKISRKTIHDGAVSIDGEVSARVLKLGLHNGRCFRTRLLQQGGKNHSSGRVKHRVRARPLIDSNAELLRLLSQEGFYGGDAHRKAKRGKDDDEALRREWRKQQERSVSDATSLSPQEIAILCDLFSSNKNSASATSSHAQDNNRHRSTRIKCDREGKTGLLALLSLHPQAVSGPQQPQQNASVQPERNVPVPKEEEPKRNPSVVALHSDRLKRVLALMKANQVGLQEVFALFDLDKDGHLSREEFVQALRSMDTVFADLSDDDLLAIVRAMDANNDGRIDYKEFVAFVASSTTTDARGNKSADQWQDEIKRIVIRAKEKGIPIHKIFAELDASGDGNLSYDEFGQALRKLGVPEEHVTKNRMALMASFDKDNDGQISYEEFLQTLGISVEANKADVVKASVQDIDATVRKPSSDSKSKASSCPKYPKTSAPSAAGMSTLQALECESIHAYVKKINLNGDDVIDYRAFLTLCGVTGKALKQQDESFRVASRVQAEKKLIKLLVRAYQANITIEQVFEQFDANADGTITVAEFHKSLAQLFQNQGLSQEDVAVITSRFDENGDGEISFPEFQRFGREIQANQHTLLDIFLPHSQKLADVEKTSSKLPLGKWQTLCSKDLKLSKQHVDTIKPLLCYFELMDATKKVDLTQLCALLAVSPAANDSNSSLNTKRSEDVKKNTDGVTRLRGFLQKARSMGADTNAMFAEFDANGDGEITREEFKSIIQKLGCFDDLSEKELDAMMMELDEDKSAKISLQEFKALVGERDDTVELLTRFAKLLDEAAKHGFTSEKCFAHFDKDGGGKISKDEFVNGMIELGFGADEHTLNEIFGILDRDASGEICFKEFKQLFSGGFDARSTTDGQVPSTEAAVPAGEAAQKQLDSASTPASKPSDSVKAALRAPQPITETVTTRDRLRALLQQAELSGHDVSACFVHFDGDGDGKITTEEFSQGMKALAGFEDVTASDLRSLVSELDSDGSGNVSLDEFKAFVRNGSGNTLDDTAQEPGASEAKKSEDHDESKKVEGSKRMAEGQESRQNEDVKEAAQHTAEPLTEAQPVQGASGEDGKETTKDNQTALVIATTNDEGAPSAKPGSAEDSPALKESAIPKPGRKPLARSSSFASGRGKPPSFASAKQRTNTDPNSTVAAVDDASVAPAEVSAGQPEEIDASSKKPVRAVPQRALSFAAVKAAAARKAASSSQPDSSSSEVSEVASSTISVGLEKLRTLLQTAQKQGIDIQVSFDHFDEDKNGRLTYAELSRGLKKLGGNFAELTDEQVAGMAKEVDRQQQGEINVQDLVELIRGSSSTVPSSTLTAVETGPPPSANKDNAANAVDASAPEEAEKAVPEAKPAPASARTAATDPLSKGAPVRRTSSLRSAAKKAGPGSDSVVVVASKPSPALKSQVAKAASGAVSTEGDNASIALRGTANATAASSVRATTENQKSKTAQDPPNDAQPAKPSGTESVVPLSAIGEMDDCAYSFHPDPRIRAVELKLRRAAMGAYSRGILPVRVISKFLDHDNNGQSTHRGSRKARDELLRVEFLQVLMELGFSLLSDTQDGDDEEGVGMTRHGGALLPVTWMNDYLYARQLERLSRYKHHISEETKAQKQLVRAVTKMKRVQQQQQQQAQRQKIAAEDSLRRFAEEKTQLLRVLSYYRDGQKKSLVYGLIRDQVTTAIMLAPSFGALIFCELPFQNPYNHHERFRIEIVPPTSSPVLLDVDLVKNGAEWAFYRENVPLAYGGGDDGQTATVSSPVEQEMIDDHNEVVMDAHDRIPIPVRLRWLDATTQRVCNTKARGDSNVSTAIPVSMVIRSCTHGHTVALFKMQSQPRPMICHRVLRFSHPSGSIWRWQMRCPRGKYLVCMDPSIVVDDADGNDTERQLVDFKCRVGEYPSLEEFYVVLYDDKYHTKVHEIWQFRIQAKLRVDIHAVVGQRAKNELIIRGDHAVAGDVPGASVATSNALRRGIMLSTCNFVHPRATHSVPRARKPRGRGHARTRGCLDRARVDFAAADHQDLRPAAATGSARAEKDRVHQSVGVIADNFAALERVCAPETSRCCAADPEQWERVSVARIRARDAQDP
ncbi:Nephrocystin-4-like protein, partial [Globisporangium splendens]